MCSKVRGRVFVRVLGVSRRWREGGVRIFVRERQPSACAGRVAMLARRRCLHFRPRQPSVCSRGVAILARWRSSHFRPRTTTLCVFWACRHVPGVLCSPATCTSFGVHFMSRSTATSCMSCRGPQVFSRGGFREASSLSLTHGWISAITTFLTFTYVAMKLLTATERYNASTVTTYEDDKVSIQDHK